MSHRHAICLVIDGLRASALGAYGNTQFPTPHLDLLASKSVVAEWMLADSTTLSGFYRSAWQGKHALRADSWKSEDALLSNLACQQVSPTLLTDEPYLAGHAEGENFDDVLLYASDHIGPTEGMQASSLESFFASVVDQLPDWKSSIQDKDGLLWCHSRGMVGPWDAPLAYQQELLDVDDPPATEFAEPPLDIRDIVDPDLLLSYRVGYAAQIMLLDTCVGALISAVDDLFNDTDTLVMLVGSRGMALGEHESIGVGGTGLYSERIHLPWLSYHCGNSLPQWRAPSLMQPTDIGTSLEAWFGVDDEFCNARDGLPVLLQPASANTQQRDLAVAMGEHGERMVRTPAWQLMSQGTGEKRLCQLFTKPDDRWDCNDISGLCPKVVRLLCDELSQFEQLAQSGEPLPRTAVHQELTRSGR